MITYQELKNNSQINMELQFKEQFYDATVLVIPGTRQRVSRTEQNQQLTDWMKKTKHIPLQYMWENGIKVELSNIFEAKIKDALQRGCAIGADGRKYTFENPENLFPICSSICVRAIPEGETGSEAYDVVFFV